MFSGKAQLAVDTTMVCALHRDGRPRRGAADHDGVALTAEEGKNVPLTPWTSEEGSICGHWLGSRGTMEARRASLAHALGSDVRLCCPCGGVILVGHAAESRRGWVVSWLV